MVDIIGEDLTENFQILSDITIKGNSTDIHTEKDTSISNVHSKRVNMEAITLAAANYDKEMIGMEEIKNNSSLNIQQISSTIKNTTQDTTTEYSNKHPTYTSDEETHHTRKVPIKKNEEPLIKNTSSPLLDIIQANSSTKAVNEHILINKTYDESDKSNNSNALESDINNEISIETVVGAPVNKLVFTSKEQKDTITDKRIQITTATEHLMKNINTTLHYDKKEEQENSKNYLIDNKNEQDDTKIETETNELTSTSNYDENDSYTTLYLSGDLYVKSENF